MNGKTTKKRAAKTSEQQTKGTSGKKQNNLTSKKKEKVHWYQKTGWILFLLFMFFPVGIVLTWRNKKWNKNSNRFCYKFREERNWDSNR